MAGPEHLPKDIATKGGVWRITGLYAKCPGTVGLPRRP
jgi:hypothetical protein